MKKMMKKDEKKDEKKNEKKPPSPTLPPPSSTSPPPSSTHQVVLLPDLFPDVPAPARDWEVVLLPDSLPDVPAPAQVVLLPDSSPDVPALARDREVVLLPDASLDLPAPAQWGHLLEVHSTPMESLQSHCFIGGGPNRSDRLLSDALRKRIKREQETPEQRNKRLSEKTLRQRIKREEETPRASDMRRRMNRERNRPEPRFGSAACRRRHIDESGYTWGCASEYAEHWPKYAKMPVFGKTMSGEPKVCHHCKALLFADEQPNECCMYGDVHCELLPDAPELVQHLCDPSNTSLEAKNFRENILAYNVALSFGTLSTVSQMPPGQGPPVVMLNGQQTQQIGNLRPGLDAHGSRKDPLFGQVYVLTDLSAATDARMGMAASRRLDRNVMRQLESLIRSVNPLAQRLISLGKQLERAERGESLGSPLPQHFRLSILDNRPAPGQVCALFESRGEDPPNPALNGIWIMFEGNQLRKIDIWNPNADMLLFTVMFPRATQTYGRGMPRNSLRQTPQLLFSMDDDELLEAVATEVAEPEVQVIDIETNQPLELHEAVPSPIPAIEPSNWNDELDTADVEIPETMVRQLVDVIEIDDAPTFRSAADLGDGRNDIARSILRATAACQDNVVALITGEEVYMSSFELDAYLCALTQLNLRSAAVVMTSFGTAELFLPLQNREARAVERPILARNHVYGDLTASEVVLIPRLHIGGLPGQIDVTKAIGHFTLGVYYPGTSELHHFDSLLNPLDSGTIAYYHRVIGTLDTRGENRFHLRTVTARPIDSFNHQNDGTSCGFWVLLYAEMVLQRGLEQTYLPNFGRPELQRERDRILEFLHALTDGRFPAYQPPPPSHRRQVVDVLHRPIGDYVPYNANLPICSADVEDSMPIDEDICIETDRADETTRTYRPRTRGPAKFASRRDYWVYQMQRRKPVGQHHPILSFGKLTQKLLIHQAWLVFFNEEEHQRRLQNTSRFRRTLKDDFLAYHQRNLQRRNAEDPNAELQTIGRVYQMPRTARQSSKNVHLNITRAMAIRKAVNPKCGMFVTFTFNCKCTEIVELIGSSANPADYPDLCCRVSTAKFRQLLKLVSGPTGILGPVKAWTWSLEYQKRGNKHWHLVLMNDPDDRVDPNSAEYVNQYISARIPDKPEPGDLNYDAKLYYYNLVVSLYIHDCADNENAACRVGRPDGQCRFGFPKRFNNCTTVNSDTGEPVTYARPSPEQGGNYFVKRYAGGRQRVIDNRYVVPHNRTLTMLMGSHVCVEFITKYSIWFYLFKYNYKLDTKVLTALYVQDSQNPNVYHADEFNVRRELAFYGPFEAVDILRSERWAGRSHDPSLLTVHLEGQEPVFFVAGHEEAAERRLSNPEFRTKWTAYMQLCREEPGARLCRFEEIEAEYTFHAKDPITKEYIWRFEPRLRQSRGGMHIGMIYPPSRKNRELFATYLLALELRGIQSFEDLRSLNRPTDRDYDSSRLTTVCANAIEAAVRRNLLADDDKWVEVMEKVSCTIHNSRQLVRFFVSLLLFSQPSDPKAILDRFIERFLAPPQRARSNDREIRYQQLLRSIQRQLEDNNCTMRQYGLPDPEPDNRTTDERVVDDLIPPVFDPQTGDPIGMTDAERMARATALYERLNAQQRAFVDSVFDRSDELRNTHSRVSNLFLLEGAAGTGKTTTLNVLIELCNARGIPIRACASTGKAATHLLGGSTAHSLFGIPVVDDAEKSEIRTSTVTADSYKGNLLRRIAIFIVDEIGMLHVDDIYCIDRLLRDLHRTGVRYGRVLMIFTGDVRQLMPIVKNADPLGTSQAEASFFFSPECRNVCTRVVLTDNMRVRQGPNQASFLAWQESVGSDRCEHVRFPQDRYNRHTRYIRLPNRFVRFDEDAFIAELYSREVLEGDPMQLACRVLLAPLNSIVDRINERVTAMMPPTRPSRTYLSATTPDAYDVYDPSNAVFSTDNLQSINTSNLPVHALKLRIGMPVMCMQNLDVSNGICNGTTMIVERLDPSVVWCRVNTRLGQRLQPIAPTNFTYKSNGFKFTRTQLPLRVAFAATINRAQGGTYDYVAYHARYPVWAHGMLFTAVTRVTSPEGLTILCSPELTVPSRLRDASYGTTRNVVHPWVSGISEHIGPIEPTNHLPMEAGNAVEEQEMEPGPDFQSQEPAPARPRQ